MKRIVHITLLSFFLMSLSIRGAYADISFDIPETVNNVTKWIGEVASKIEDKAQIVKDNALAKLKKGTDKAKAKYLDKVEKAENSKLAKKAEKAKKAADDAKLKAQADEIKDAKKLAELSKERAEIEQKYKEELELKSASIDAKIAKYTENNNINKRMLDDGAISSDEFSSALEANNVATEALRAEKAKVTQEINDSKSSATKKLDEEIYNLTKKMAERAKQKAIDEKAKTVSGEQSVTQQQVLDMTYLKPGEAPGAKRIQELRDLRNRAAYQDLVAAYAKTVDIKSSRQDDDELMGVLARGVEKMDTEADAVNVYTEMLVENSKALADYLDIVITQVKTLAAGELARSSSYELADSNKNLTILNLCDYQYIPSGGK